jgi:hypothetical protein
LRILPQDFLEHQMQALSSDPHALLLISSCEPDDRGAPHPKFKVLCIIVSPSKKLSLCELLNSGCRHTKQTVVDRQGQCRGSIHIHIPIHLYISPSTHRSSPIL